MKLAGELLDAPTSACGANLVPSVDEWATVVVSGCELAGDFTAEFIGVVVTGWLGTALPAVATVVATAAVFAGPVAAFTGSLSAEPKDGVRPAGPLVARLENPEETVPAGYGAVAPGCADIEW